MADVNGDVEDTAGSLNASKGDASLTNGSAVVQQDEHEQPAVTLIVPSANDARPAVLIIGGLGEWSRGSMYVCMHAY